MKSRKPNLTISIPLANYPDRSDTLENRFRAVVPRAFELKRKLIMEREQASAGDDIGGLERRLEVLSDRLERLLGLPRVRSMVLRLEEEGWEGGEGVRVDALRG